MKICPKCNLEYGDEFNFCRSCGSKLVQKVEERVCPGCGRRLEAAFEFCPYCGSTLVLNKNVGTINTDVNFPNQSNYQPKQENINDSFTESSIGNWLKTIGILIGLLIVFILIMILLGIFQTSVKY
jgi:RNA polymerase subunit RPABC4/transcription elongation factor Spt4